MKKQLSFNGCFFRILRGVIIFALVIFGASWFFLNYDNGALSKSIESFVNFASKKKEETEDALYHEYTSELLYKWINDSFTGRVEEPELKVIYNGCTDYTNLMEEWKNMITTNPAFSYYETECSVNLSGKGNTLTLTMHNTYDTDKPRLEEIVHAKNKTEALRYIMDELVSGYETIYVFLNENVIAREEISDFMCSAVENDVCDLVVYCSDMTYSFYPGFENGNYILEMKCRLDWTTKDAISTYREETQKAIDNITAGIDENASEEEKIKKVFEAVCLNAQYDYELASSIFGTDISDSCKLNMKTYGALITGGTVCSGYASAFKAVCDNLGIDSWIIRGRLEGEAHSWNMVLTGGEIRYVDATQGDCGEFVDYSYCLASLEELRNKWDYRIDENNFIPENFEIAIPEN